MQRKNQKKRNKTTHFLLILLFLLTKNPTLFANDLIDWGKIESYSEDSLSRHLGSISPFTTWIKGSNKFYYSLTNGKGLKLYYIVDAQKHTKKQLFDNAVVLSMLNEEKDAKIDIRNVEFRAGDTRECVFAVKDKFFKYKLLSHKIEEITKEEKKNYVKKDPQPKIPLFSKQKYSSDSLFCIYGRGHNICLYSNKDKKERQLTEDGEPFYSYNTSSQKELDDTTKIPTIATWLSDSHIVLSFREDKRKIGDMSLTNSLAQPRPQTQTYKMPMPGDKYVSQYSLDLFYPDTEKSVNVDLSKYKDQKVELNYLRTAEKLFLTRRSRPADKIDLCLVDPRTGTLKELIQEECKPHLNLQLFNYHLINGGEEILFWSERTGYGHYYLYDGNGKLKNAVTSGDFVAGRIFEIDTLARTMIFEGYGREKNCNPEYRFYYKVNFDGSNLSLLTPGDGTHSISLSSDKKFIVDTYSRPDLLPISQTLKIGSKKKAFVFEQADMQRLLETGWKPPSLIKTKAADNKTDLYGVMYLPFDLDTTKRYPIITNVYPGPQENFVPLGFSLDDNKNQTLAQLGFVVINIGSRGSSTYRGRDFHCFGFGNLRDYPLADNKHIIETLAKAHPFIDLERVGIYGHSGGGFMTVAAMLQFPDFYKVGVAASGNYDNNIYIQWWGEVYHGIKELVDPSDGSVRFETKIPTTLELAEKLQGRLFLITGGMDKNVHPSTTMRMADAFIKANKRFDMMVIPKADHGVDSKYYYNLIRYYFIEHLLSQPQQDIDIVNHK